MPTASMKAETNGVTDSNDPLDRIQNELASRLSELEEKKVELNTDPAHPRAVFYKNLSKDVIQYKKLTPDQLNHLREMDAVYSTLEAVKEISEIVNDCINEHRTRFKKQQKKASQEKAREIFERVKEVLKIQSSLELAVTHPQLFLEPPSPEHPATSSELLEKLQRIHGLITPQCVTESTKSIGDTVHSAAQHIHLLVDGRNKFVTKGTTYEDVKAQFIDRASVCSYYIEKVVEPEPEEPEETAEEEVEQLASELDAAQLSQPQDKAEAEVAQQYEGAEADSGVADSSASPNQGSEVPAPGLPLDKAEDHLAISSSGHVPIDPSAAVYMMRDPTQPPPPPPPGLQPHPQQAAAAPLLMGQALPQQQALQSQEAFAAALTQQQQQHMHVMYQLEHQQHMEQQQHILQQREQQQQQQQHQQHQQQQQQQQQLEEDQDDGSSIHNDSIKDLLTLSDFNFLQESVIDKPAARDSPAPSVSEAAVYMDPAIVSVVSMCSVNPAESGPVPAAESLVAPVDHFMAAAAAAAAPAQPQLPLAAQPPPAVVTSQKLSLASNNLATIPTPNFPPTVPPPTTSLANVPPPPVHASNARPPPANHPLESDQFFSHAAPAPPHSTGYQNEGLNYSAPPAAPAPTAAQTSLTPTLDSTPNPPPPIPLPQEHSSSSWDQPSQSWGDDQQPQMNGGGQTSPSHGTEVQQSAASDWSAAPVEDKSRRSNRSWGSEDGDNIAGNWGSDVRSPPRAPPMSQQDDYDRKMAGVNTAYRNGPHHRMRRDGGDLEDYGSHDDGGYWGEEDYDDRRGGMYPRARGGRGRINNHSGGYRGRGGYNGNSGYQNGRGGYGPQSGFRNRGGLGGANGGGYRGMRGANRGGGGMPRGGGGSAGGAYRSGRGNYPVQRPYYGQ